MKSIAFDTSVPVVVLVLRPSAVQHRALSIARSAGRLGIPVYGVLLGRPGPDVRSRYLRSVEVLPAKASAQQCLDALLRVGGRLGRALLVPIDDAGIVLVDDHAEMLNEVFLFPRRPPGVGRLLASKRELHLLCQRSDVPTPAAFFPATADEAVEQAQELGYPVVAKRIEGWLSSTDPRAPSVHIASDPTDLSAAYARMRSPSQANVMLQEFLPGSPQSVWMFNGYFDERSEALVAFTGRKLRQHPPYTGVTSLGEAAANEDVERHMRRLLQGVGYRGIVDADLRLDARDGEYKVLDVNPRIGSTFRLFVGENGLDVLRASHLDLTGLRVPSTRQRLGRRWIAEPLDADSALRSWRAGEISLRDWARSLAGIEEAAWLAVDDPMPALAVTRPLAAAGTRRLADSARRPVRASRAAPARPAPANPHARVRPSSSPSDSRNVTPRRQLSPSSAARRRGAGHADQPLACVMGDMDLIRPLGLAGIRCAAVANRGGATRFSRFTCAWVERHDGWKQQQAQVDELLRFARSQPSPPVLFYGGDPELLIVARYQDVLRDAFRFVVPDARVVDDVVDKARFRELAARLDLPVPASWHLRPAHEPAPDDALPFPLMVKPLTRQPDVWVPIAGAVKALRVDTPAELRAVWPRLAAADVEVLVQEVVPGSEARIESYHAYIDEMGEFVGEFTGRKVRTLPLEYGHSTALITTDAADVAALGREIVERVGLNGLVKVDFKCAPGGELRLLEINPRFSLWHHLGAVAGVNLPALVYADLAGLPRPRITRARPGVTWSQPWHDLPAARASGMSTLAWLAWTARCPAKSVIAWDDPMPFLRGRLWNWLVRGTRSRLRSVPSTTC